MYLNIQSFLFRTLMFYVHIIVFIYLPKELLFYKLEMMFKIPMFEHETLQKSTSDGVSVASKS
jgi:hypothetical protein